MNWRKALTKKSKYIAMCSIMRKVLYGRGRLLAAGVAALLLLSCRSTVPQPTMSLEGASKPLPQYAMHNVGPQRALESRAVKFVDLNMDGHVDILVGGRDKTEGFHVELGDGEGHWQLVSGPDTGMQPRAFAVADVNMDGAPEVLIGGEGDREGLQIWRLDEAGAWRLHSVPVESGKYREVRLADVNRDGWPDIVAARLDDDQSGGIDVLLNDAQGGWVAGVGPVDEGRFTGVSVIDLNGDGAMDLVASRRGGLGAVAETGKEYWRQVGGVQIWYGDGDGRWEPEVLFADGDAESVTVADVDGDGALDVVAGLYQGGIRMWRKHYSDWTMHRLVDKGSWSDVRVGDLDGDGRRELIASSSDGKGIRVWSWRAGSFAARSGLLPNYGIYYALDFGDTRNRGQIDIAAARADGGVEVWSGLKAEPTVVREVPGELVGEPLELSFNADSADLSEEALHLARSWTETLTQHLNALRFEVDVHDAPALSQARGEAVAAWLIAQGAKQNDVRMQVRTLGLESGGADRQVVVRAYQVRSVRLPKMSGEAIKRDLFHVDENSVFKIIDGIPDYKIGSGDKLSMTFWRGGKGEEHVVTVQVDGTVSLPYQEALQVTGLTSREIDAKITTILSRYERRPRVDVQVLEFKSKTASIFGEVQSLARQPTGPGNYHLMGRESLVDFLSRAGGPTKDADLSRVQIIRDGKTVVLNLEQAIKQGDWAENAMIDAGDRVVVPSLAQSMRKIYVLGAVGKPGVVEFNGDINFLDAVTQSGGLGENAYLADIRVVRADRDKPLILAVNFKRFMEQGDLSQNLALQDNDVLIIPSRPVANWNKFIGDIQPTISLLMQPVSITTQILTIEALTRRVP